MLLNKTIINSDKWMSCKKNVIFPLLRVQYLWIYDDVKYISAPVGYISQTNSVNFDGHTNYYENADDRFCHFIVHTVIHQKKAH